MVLVMEAKAFSALNRHPDPGAARSVGKIIQCIEYFECEGQQLCVNVRIQHREDH